MMDRRGVNQIYILDERFCLDAGKFEMYVKKIYEFQEGMKNSGSCSLYSKNRNANTPDDDIRLGMQGEVGAAEWAAAHGFPKVNVDFCIRKGYDKGWYADLGFSLVDPVFVDGHVKTAGEKTLRVAPLSWLFQSGNKDGIGGVDTLFNDSHSYDIIFFMYVPVFGQNEFWLKAIAPWHLVKPLMADPVLSYLKKYKRAVYFNALERASRGC